MIKFKYKIYNDLSRSSDLFAPTPQSTATAESFSITQRKAYKRLTSIQILIVKNYYYNLKIIIMHKFNNKCNKMIK